MELIVRSGCEDGNCPKISDVADGGADDMVAVQGPAAPVRPGVPDHESVVLVPRQIVLEYADKFRAEAARDA
jgi:hypothetical protein